MLRVPATRRGERVGQLVVNPGGPGGSGVDYAAGGADTFGRPLTRYFDIVGFDPRGVGESTPLECADTKQTDEFSAPTRTPTPRRKSPSRRRHPRVRPGLPHQQRRPGPPHLHGRGRQGHRHPAGGAGRAAAGLPRRVVRHPPRRHLRRPVPDARPPDGARRRRRPDAVQRAALPRSGARFRDRADGLPAGLRRRGQLRPRRLRGRRRAADQGPARPARHPAAADLERPRAHRGARQARHRPTALRQGVLAPPHHRAEAGDPGRQRRPAARALRPVHRARPRPLHRQLDRGALRRQLPRPRRQRPGATRSRAGSRRSRRPRPRSAASSPTASPRAPRGR